MTVKVTNKGGYLKVYIDSHLHLAVPSKNLSIQSWKQGKKSYLWYYIEFGATWAKYDNPKLWKKILKELDRNI